jgi:hypothetical protein
VTIPLLQTFENFFGSIHHSAVPNYRSLMAEHRCSTNLQAQGTKLLSSSDETAAQ